MKEKLKDMMVAAIDEKPLIAAIIAVVIYLIYKTDKNENNSEIPTSHDVSEVGNSETSKNDEMR